MQELVQVNGKNRRTYSLTDTGITIEEVRRADNSERSFSFAQLGLRKPDYRYRTRTESRFATATRRLGFVSFLLSWGCGFAYADFAHSNPASPVGTLFLALGIVALGFAIFVIGGGLKRVRYKVVYFANDRPLNFYYREIKEQDQVEGFLKDYDAAFLEFSKKQLLKVLESTAPYPAESLQQWLDQLHEKGVFNDEEYHQSVEAIKLRQKNAATEK